jgi:hypothetical protein
VSLSWLNQKNSATPQELIQFLRGSRASAFSCTGKLFVELLRSFVHKGWAHEENLPSMLRANPDVTVGRVDIHVYHCGNLARNIVRLYRKFEGLGSVFDADEFL